jgi:hypothetical protein
MQFWVFEDTTHFYSVEYTPSRKPLGLQLFDKEIYI